MAVTKYAKLEVCSGCNVALVNYGITTDAAYHENGNVYCCSDCAMEAGANARDVDDVEWMAGD